MTDILSDDEAMKLANECLDGEAGHPEYWQRNAKQLARKVLSLIEGKRWIPVSERLPDDHGLFLCATEAGLVVIHAFEVGVGWKNIRNGDSEYWNAHTAYWMPLPFPPWEKN
jgi:hypothetical protein